MRALIKQYKKQIILYKPVLFFIAGLNLFGMVDGV